MHSAFHRMTSLEEISDRLRAHFEHLKAGRDHRTQGAVYVLEHPLTTPERAELTRLLQCACKAHSPMAEHWLAWLVFATEVGYSFSGSDYWPRLEDRIPNWIYADRERLASWFKRFAKEFGGAYPEGPWAAQFRLIAWPITHAILPSDLQVQLSRAIHNARHALFGIDERSDEDLGNVVADRWVPRGDRFERLLQRPAFVGTLVRLLLQRSVREQAIADHALVRIVQDVESHTEARTWLRDARNVCQPKARLAAPVARPTPATPVRPRFSPDVVLHNDAGKWSMHVRPGSAIGLVADAPQLARSLQRLRFSVAGNPNQAFLAKDLLRADPRHHPMSHLPPPGVPLLTFLPTEDSDAIVLTKDCVPASRPLWLFKVRADGDAWLQSVAAVIPGNRYLLGTQDPAQRLPGVPLPRTCGGLRLAELNLPDVIPEAESEALSALGLAVAKRTTIRPWGILPRLWREDGFAEYVVGDVLLWRVERDHEFDALRIVVDQEPAREFPCPGAEPFVLELAGLGLGAHAVTLTTLATHRARSVTTLQSMSSVGLHVYVREPSVWRPGALPSEALAVTLSPPELTLAQVLRGSADVSVEGALDDTLEVEVVVTDGAGVRHPHPILRRRPPISADEWHSHLEGCLKESDLALHALAATQAQLSIGSDHFGWHRAELAVFPESVRWSVDRRGQDFVVRLATDDAETPEVTFYPRETPCRAHPLPFEDVRKGVVGSDGLYVANHAMAATSLVLSATPARMTLSQLQAQGAFVLEHVDAVALLECLHRWIAAPTVGRIASSRQAQVVVALRTRLVRLVAGHDWSAAEERAQRHGRLADLDVAVAPAVRNFGINLGQWRHLTDAALLRENFLRASTQYGVCPDRERAEFAWRLVFGQPSSTDAAGLTEHLRDPHFFCLVRGARLIELGYKEATA